MAKKKKKPKYSLLFTIVLLIVIGIVAFFVYPKVKEYLDNNSHIVTSGELEIHFLELGNKYTGDSIYIKVGDVDVLIDAGSRQNSAVAINNYLEQHMEDDVIEYVIATHAHQDHIAGFTGDTGIFELFVCETIIDFPLTNSTSQVSQRYYDKRDAEVTKGAKHYNALECYQNTNGAQRKYALSDEIELEILYNYYYENETNDENDYSVCIMINQGTRHFLFTGDLEEKGEEYLVQYNELPEVEVFKAGHHGSKTSSNNELLSVIKPKIVCVCCCAGSSEYTTEPLNQFPTQDFISRISKYTDQVYVTSIVSDNEAGYTSFNGNIVITSTSTGVVVNCSYSNVILKESEWFKKNRIWE